MNITPGYDNAASYDGSVERLPAGGYICRILKAWCENSANGSEMLVLALEIAEGEYAGYAKRQFERKKANNPNAAWGCTLRQLTLGFDGQTSPYFKGLIKSIEESNAGYKWNWQEATLANKMVGMIFREEEFETNTGDIKTTVRPAFPRSVQSIRDGVKTPEIKRLRAYSATAPSNTAFTTVEDEKMPWE